MRHSRNTWIYSLILLLAAALLALPFAQAASVEPMYVEGNPSCSDLSYPLEFKVDPPNPGTYNVEGFGSVTLASADGIYFDWSSTFGVDAVIAKGGNGAYVYAYSPEATGDSELRSPDNFSGGPAELSHVSFCYDADPPPTETPPTEVTPTEDPATEVPPTEVPPTEVPPTEVPPTEVPPTEVPPTEVPPTEVPPTEVPPTEVPPTEVPPTEVPPTQLPATAVPPTPTNTQVPPAPTNTQVPPSVLAVAGELPSTPEAVYEVLPATGGGAPALGNLNSALGVALTLAGGVAAWVRRRPTS